jgi:predicted nucleotidyltransferase component of viral defense system
VIPARELLDLRAEWQLDVGVIEKDYVLGWMLAAIGNEPDLAGTWIFKGGTCLRKCYYETYRFSEDLDFTVIGGGPETPEDLMPIFRRVSDWLREQSGIELLVDDRSFVRKKNKRSQPTTLGRLAYRGPNQEHNLPKLKIDITSDEILAYAPDTRLVGHQYTDKPLPGNGVQCYAIVELFAEKIRALAERCRPRDLYDVVHMHRHPDLIGRAPVVVAALEQKCQHAGIPVPDAATIQSSPFRAEIEQEWENMLGHQLPKPTPLFGDFWSALDDVFAWLVGTLASPALARIEARDLDPAWSPPLALTSWRLGFPLELVRYSGANRMKVEIDYRAETGRRGPRIVEPYSLRQTKDGNLLLFVINDRGLLRGYRLDRIAGVRPTTEIFSPRFRVEF